MTVEKISLNAIVPQHMHGQRLDSVAVNLFEGYSRAVLQKWIKAGCLTVNGEHRKPKDKVLSQDYLVLTAKLKMVTDWIPEALPLDIVFEDSALLVINKPAGLVVHPAAGNYTGTVANALLYYYSESRQLPRAGIVHRLDKDTTGLMVVAKCTSTYYHLVEQLQQRSVSRKYKAIAEGVLVSGGKVDAPIGRHSFNRLKMAVTDRGKTAVTHYRVAERFAAHTLIDLQLETGRTHQIRVHMQYIYHPLLGDPLYGGRPKIPTGASDSLLVGLRNFKRQALHAWSLGFIHPEDGRILEFIAPLSLDMESLIGLLRTG